MKHPVDLRGYEVFAETVTWNDRPASLLSAKSENSL